MIRTTAVPRHRLARSVRVGTAAASVAGIVALAGCGAAATGDTAEDTGASSAAADPTPTAASTGSASTDSSGSTYADGTYTAEGSYQTPESVETISVTVTLENDVITAVEVTGNPTKRESEEYQADFIGGIQEVVVGKDIDEISVSRVAGSSLTSGGFNDAIAQIKDEAAA